MDELDKKLNETFDGDRTELGLVVQGLTSHDPKERADLLRTLLTLQCGNGLMHESGGWVRESGVRGKDLGCCSLIRCPPHLQSLSTT